MVIFDCITFKLMILFANTMLVYQQSAQHITVSAHKLGDSRKKKRISHCRIVDIPRSVISIPLHEQSPQGNCSHHEKNKH
jgi:hypothetical protein